MHNLISCPTSRSDFRLNSDPSIRGIFCRQDHASLHMLPRQSEPPTLPSRGRQARAAHIRRLAVTSLYAELQLHPKPGLVTPLSNGSHRDMDATIFLRSLFALRHYFNKIAGAGIDGAPFPVLRQLGIDAEATMMIATGGVNTHRGAIFCLGLLSAALGASSTTQDRPTQQQLRSTLTVYWGVALHAHANGAGGARRQAANGFPAIFDIGLPQLHATLAAGRSWSDACIDTLFALMAHIDDSNVVHRGADAGAMLVHETARQFLRCGGTAHPQWRQLALEADAELVAHNLSPGGAADLLAATCFVHCATRTVIGRR